MANEYRRHVGRRVVVQIETTEHAIEGTLVRAGHDALALTDAELIEHNKVFGEMDGEVVIPTARVLWVQVV